MALPYPSLTRFAVVTGASQGIGEAIARKLASLGHNLILVARREEILSTLAEELRTTHGVDIEVFPADLADANAVTRLIEFMDTKEIHIIVNSAGIASFGPFIEQDWEYEKDQFNLNATAVFRLTNAVVHKMAKRKEGAICNVGSAAGNVAIPNNATYVFTKAGVNAFTEALHYELKKKGVHCTLLAPGPVRDAVVPEEDKTIVDRVVPDFLWTTYESCAQDTIDAMAANKRRVVPGPLSKGMDFIGSYGPRRIIAPLVGWFYAKMA